VEKPSKRQSAEDRRAQIAQLQASQQRAERRRTRILTLVIIVIALALVIPTAALIISEQRRNDEVAAVASSPIAGERVVPSPAANHVTGDVPASAEATLPATNGVLPPVGGDHDPQVQNCGYYATQIRNENAVHSMEHGAVWLTYRPDLSESDVERLKDLTKTHPYLLVSPYPDLAAPVVASAWGVQLQVASVDEPALNAFVARYEQGPQTPELGAPCTGGVGL
jgi:hypothetical protein